ncbi:formylglycine-generating enzyme family protein [Pseudomonas aeruginosa]|uniref:formylglycine-generating enzyme family protein n=1 Tax=Pseudomonas aeruginosa TaxID=287 RepID=UPI000F5BD4F5|nr:formylglycine-generating enzyme family protein [Pseudomonas aeruginosa]RQJ00862.1 formylglycine-generating sulfatase enzyme [Pseudomonas aeruginosa]HEJ3624775.1 formylglycine-generating enzyme family protein [Pseudomonas aeruginosa]
MITSKVTHPMLLAFISAGLFTTTEASQQETISALESLAEVMVWTSTEQCAPTYDKVLKWSDVAKQVIASEVTSQNSDRHYTQFLKSEVEAKLASLDEEVRYLRSRCIATDYDSSSLSLERPSRLQQMLQEWRSTILWASRTILSSRYPYKYEVTRAETLTPPRNPQPLERFRDCADNFCQEMVAIPSGEFLMGGSDEEAIAEGVNPTVATWERPRHKVHITKPFAMAAEEVTLGAFRQFVAETGYSLPQGCTSLTPPADPTTGLATLVFSENSNYENPGFAQRDEQPVVCVRREDGRAYARWLSQKTGQQYRLPTEAEWEYAARAGTQTTFFWGNDREQACLYANVYDQTSDETYRYGFRRFECRDNVANTAPVGSFLPNQFGIHDLLANAREWVDDCWHYGYQLAPEDGSLWSRENGGLCQFGVLRGGAWAYNTVNVRVAYRNAYFSSQARAFMWGFRMVRDI